MTRGVPMIDPKVDLAGATPETLARALFRPLRASAGVQPVVGDQPAVAERAPHEPDGEPAHLVEGV